MPTITVLRQPQGKLGFRLSPDNTVSEVHKGGAAEAGGLREGWLVRSINGKVASSLSEVAQEQVKQNVFKFILEVDSKWASAAAKRKASPEHKVSPGRPPKIAKAAAAKVVAPKAKLKMAEPKVAAAPKPATAKATAPKASSPSPKPAPFSSGALLQRRLGGMSPSRPSPSPTRSPVVERTRLLALLESRTAPDLMVDVSKLVQKNDAAAIELLSRMYPAGRAPKMCVFCGDRYTSGASGTCSTKCDIEWDMEDRDHHGHADFKGSCSLCGETHYVEHACEDTGPEKDFECYKGPHRSDRKFLTEFRRKTLGEAEYNEVFAGKSTEDDAEY